MHRVVVNACEYENSSFGSYYDSEGLGRVWGGGGGGGGGVKQLNKSDEFCSSCPSDGVEEWVLGWGGGGGGALRLKNNHCL
uniref:Uncharacterized protein n=1 Tax=Knipowitschia caucasica TaxID=637954 RepID=A0AAV2LTH9_KNICA